MLLQNIPKQHRIYLKLAYSIELYEVIILFYLKGKTSSRCQIELSVYRPSLSGRTHTYNHDLPDEHSHHL